MRYLLAILVLSVPSLAIADCPEAEGYTYHNLSEAGMNQSTHNYYFQLQVNAPSTTYLYIGYSFGNFASNGSAEIFNKIPKVEYDNNPYLRGFYRGYMSGELEAALHAGYKSQTPPYGPNDDIDLLAFEGDDFLACEDPPVNDLDSGELVPWFANMVTLLYVIAIATCFTAACSFWNLTIWAKNRPTWWVLFFVLVLPSVANAQGNFCNRVTQYSGYTFTPYSGTYSAGYSITVHFSDGFNASYQQGFGQYGALPPSGNPPWTGIPYDVYLSDPELRNIYNGIQGGGMYAEAAYAAQNNEPFVVGTYADAPYTPCDCGLDPSRPDCPNYTPSDPDNPLYCTDGSEDQNPENPYCGCPGQDYQICDNEECEDSDGDLCCDDEDPEPDNPECGCNRTGPMGECDKKCPECEKSLEDYMDQINILLQNHGLDLSAFLGRGETAGMYNTLELSLFWPFTETFTFHVATDERLMDDSLLKTAIWFVRIVIRMACLFFVMIYFVRNFMWVIFR